MKEKKQLRWNLADIKVLLKNSASAIIKGKFLLRLNVGRYFIHILYTFLLMVVVIWISLMIDTSLAKVEKNKETIKEMEILYSEKTFDVATYGRRSTVSKMLESMGSPVKEPQKPAMTIDK